MKRKKKRETEWRELEVSPKGGGRWGKEEGREVSSLSKLKLTSKLIPIFTLEIKKNRERNLLLPSLLFPQHEIKKKKKNKRCTKRKKKRETEWRGLEVSFERGWKREVSKLERERGQWMVDGKRKKLRAILIRECRPPLSPPLYPSVRSGFNQRPLCALSLE